MIEGHVPASTIDRLLKDRPDIRGLAVPGMPMGSPGMEVAGVEAERFEVLAIPMTEQPPSSRVTKRFQGDRFRE